MNVDEAMIARARIAIFGWQQFYRRPVRRQTTGASVIARPHRSTALASRKNQSGVGRWRLNFYAGSDRAGRR